MRSRVLLLSFTLFFTGLLFAQSARVPEIAYRSVPGFLKLPPDLYLGGSRRRRRQFERARLRILARQHHRSSLCRSRGATAGVQRRRKVSARDWTQPLCLVFRAFGQDRQRRQHLGGGQGIGHGDQVRSRGPRRNGIWPQAGSLRRRNRAAEASQASAATGGRDVSAGNRHGVGCRGQHIHQRRLYQLAHREGR